MLKQLDLDVELLKQEYRQQKDALGSRLTLLHRAAWEARVPVILVFEGWDASGKGAVINFLAQYLDPRGLKTYATRKPSKDEGHMPWLWPFWLRLPAYGEMTFFDQSWYHRCVNLWMRDEISDKVFQSAVQDILDFERGLTDDGYLLIKFFLHIGKKEQKERLEDIEDDPLQSWRVNKGDWRQHRQYKRYRKVLEDVIARTHTDFAPWTLVAATDRRFARIAVIKHTIQGLESSLDASGKLPGAIQVDLPAVQPVANQEPAEGDHAGEH